MLDWEPKFEALVTKVAQDAHAALMRFSSVYIYIVESTPNTWGQLIAVPEILPRPKNAYVAIPRKLPRNMTVEQLRAYIYNYARRLPLLPSDPTCRSEA